MTIVSLAHALPSIDLIRSDTRWSLPFGSLA